MSEVKTEKSWKIAPVGVGRRDYSQNIGRYDQEPTLLLLEGFENIPPAWLWGVTAGGSVVRDTTKAWRGGACLKITTGNAPAPTLNYAEYRQWFGLVRSMKLLMDVMVELPGVGGDHFGLKLIRYTETQRVVFEVFYSIILSAWYYINSAGGITAVPNGAQRLASGVFHHAWLAVDYQAEEFLYLQCNEKLMSLKGIPPYKPVDPQLPSAQVLFYAFSNLNPLVSFYIDNVRVSEVK